MRLIGGIVIREGDGREGVITWMTSTASLRATCLETGEEFYIWYGRIREVLPFGETPPRPPYPYTHLSLAYHAAMLYNPSYLADYSHKSLCPTLELCLTAQEKQYIKNILFGIQWRTLLQNHKNAISDYRQRGLLA